MLKKVEIEDAVIVSTSTVDLAEPEHVPISAPKKTLLERLLGSVGIKPEPFKPSPSLVARLNAMMATQVSPEVEAGQEEALKELSDADSTDKQLAKKYGISKMFVQNFKRYAIKDTSIEGMLAKHRQAKDAEQMAILKEGVKKEARLTRKHFEAASLAPIGMQVAMVI